MKPVVVQSVQHRSKYSIVDTCGQIPQSYLLPADLGRTGMPAFTLPTVKVAWYFSHVHCATEEQIDKRLPGVCILLGPLTCVSELSSGLVYPVGAIAFMPWLKPNPIDSTPQPFFQSIISLQGDREKNTQEEETEQTLPAGFQKSLPISLDENRSRLAESKSPVTCIICMDNPAEYKWYACHHASDGPALACLRCRNAICDAALFKAKSRLFLRGFCLSLIHI